MCRILVYKGNPVLLADLVTKPDHSLILQSYRSKERTEPLNGDGWGVGWYVPDISPNPCLLTSISPAWSNRNLHRLADKVQSSCIFAHLRAATGGLVVTDTNCHPFQYGNLLWMHNGSIGEFPKIKRALRACLRDDLYEKIEGTTDSEHAFYLFLHHLEKSPEECSVDEFKQALTKTIRHIVQLGKDAGTEVPHYFNFAVTNGDMILVTRYISNPTHSPESLYYASGDGYQCRDGKCEIRPLEEGQPGAFLLASEPLTDTPHRWEPVPVNHMITITDDILLEPIDA